MLSNIAIIILLVCYLFFCIGTFYTYSQNKGRKSPVILIAIYLFYSYLIGFIIFTIDADGTGFEKIIQTAVLMLIVGIVLMVHYNEVLKKNDFELFDSGFGRV